MNKQGDTRNDAGHGSQEQARLPKLAVAGGLLSALAASSCCVLPLVLFTLGAGGAWVGRLTALAPYQPVFVIIALGCLAYGFWTIYRTPACAKADSCARPGSDRLLKAGLWTSTIIVAAALAFPFLAPVLLGT
jgi:mercuric ion transport protein